MELFYKDDLTTLYCGDMRDIVLALKLKADAVITDPPYGETSLDWDRWPDGWPQLMKSVAPQMWCFGSTRMFLDKCVDLVGWKLAQDIVWEKHNGSNSANDRFRRMHELALHFYQGEWGSLYKNPQYTLDAVQKRVKRSKNRTAHWGDIGQSAYVSEDGGPRLQGSVIYCRSCHGYATNETQKPEGIVRPLIQYSVPVGGTLVDCFAGSGTMLAVARELGIRAVGIEKRESQCQDIVNRIAQLMLPFAGGIEQRGDQ